MTTVEAGLLMYSRSASPCMGNKIQNECNFFILSLSY